MHDTQSQHVFQFSALWDTPKQFRTRAEDILRRQQPKAFPYMLSEPKKITRLFATICTMTQKEMPPQEQRVKTQYDITEPAKWAAFLKQLRQVSHPNWAGAMFEMEHPDITIRPAQEAYDEASLLAQWSTEQELGPRPQPVPDVDDPESLLPTEITRQLKDEYKTGRGNGDNMLVRNPDNKNESFRLTAHRMGLWADAIVSF